ncbi:MAG: hypothetical protein PHE83_04030 [Opitutaceae bacterium]|nr:hypothetical protein [Opitutaceae bacterium]
MKTAVLISGQMRSLDVCITSIQKHVLDRIGDYDVLAHVADDEDAWKVELLEPKQCLVVAQPTFDEKNYIHRSGRGVIGIQPVLRMFWSMEESNKLRRAAEAGRGAPYDWVIRLRPDTQFFSDIEDLAACDPSAVYLPTFCNYWGYQDRFAFGGVRAMDAYHDKCALVDTCMAAGGVFHPESILKWAIDHAGVPVKRTEILFDTLRKNGSRIRPVWEERYGDVVPAWKRELTAA